MFTIRRLIGFAKRYWYWSALGFFCMIAVTALNLALPLFIKSIIDNALKNRHFELLTYYALAIIGASVIKGFFFFGQTYLTEFVSQRVTYDIRNRLFDHIQHLSFSYHDEAETGQLISRSTSDVEALRQFLGGGMFHFFTNGLMLIGITSVCLYMNWKLALIALSAMPVLGGVVINYRGKLRPLFTAVQNQLGDMTTYIQQNLMGIRVVKAFSMEEHESRQFSNHAYDLLNKHLDVARLSSFYGPMMDFIAAFGITFILWYGGMQVIKGNLSTGGLVAFYFYLAMFIMPIKIMGWVVGVAQNAAAGTERIFEILDTHPETHLKDGRIEMTKCTGHVEFRNVSSGYGDHKVLRNINLEVKPGEMVALLGETGSGKSTFINLLPRFYDVTDGAVLIDGIDVRSYRLESLRRFIGLVSQETFLFGDTVRGNIAYGNPNASLESVKEVAKAANIHDFIASLPDQYDTRIGERGVNLSGGQKQRIAIARALLMNPPILILDDSTSSVDTETEALIQQALVSLTKSRTTFVIAQRISTVKRADKIVVLENGKIAECGNHEELLAKGGLYTDLFRLQFGDHELDNATGSSVK